MEMDLESKHLPGRQRQLVQKLYYVLNTTQLLCQENSLMVAFMNTLTFTFGEIQLRILPKLCIHGAHFPCLSYRDLQVLKQEIEWV